MDLGFIDSHISAQLTASVLFLLELLFIRECVFNCFLSASEILDLEHS